MPVLAPDSLRCFLPPATPSALPPGTPPERLVSALIFNWNLALPQSGGFSYGSQKRRTFSLCPACTSRRLVSSSLPIVATHLCSPSCWQFCPSETHSFIHSSLNSFDKSFRAPVVCQHVFKLWGYKDIMWLNLPLSLLAAVITNFWFTVYHSEKILTSVLQSNSPPHICLQDKFSFL